MIDLLGRKERKKAMDGGEDANPDEVDAEASSRSKKQVATSAEEKDDDAADDEDAEKSSKGARSGSQKQGEQAEDEEAKSDEAEEEGRRGQSGSKKEDRDEEEDADQQARKRVKIISPGFPASSRNADEERHKDDMAAPADKDAPKVRNTTNTSTGADSNKHRANNDMNRGAPPGEGRKQANATQLSQDGKQGSRQAGATDGSKKERNVRKVDGEDKEPATVAEKAADIGKMAANLSKIRSSQATPILTVRSSSVFKCEF